MKGVTREQVASWFAYHRLDERQAEQTRRIREAGHRLASAILDHTSPGPDQTAAIRKVREAVWTANSAIAEGAPVLDEAAPPIAPAAKPRRKTKAESNEDGAGPHAPATEEPDPEGFRRG